MKIPRSIAFVVTGAIALAACKVYVDEPAKAPPPPPPAPAPAAPVAAKPTKVIPIHLRPGAPPATPGAPATPAAGTTAACLDTGAATVGDCGAVQTPAACSGAPTPRQKCAAFKTYFSPKVAAAAVSCLAGLSSAQVCDGTTASACAKTALAEACPQTSLSQLCQIAAAPCKTTAADCTATLSGLNQQGQTLVAQCVAQGCAGGLAACIDGLASH